LKTLFMELANRQPSNPIVISPSWQWFVQAICLIATLLYAVLAVIGTPTYFDFLKTACTNPPCLIPAQLTPARLGALENIGITVATFAWITTISLWIQILIGWGLAWVMISRRPQDPLAVLMGMAYATLPTFSIVYAFTQGKPGLDLSWRLNNLYGDMMLVTWYSLFPGGFWQPRWTRWIALSALLFYIVIDLFVIPGSNDLLLMQIYNFHWPLMFIYVAALQVYYYRRTSNAIQRQQTKWIVYSFVLNMVANLLWTLLDQFFQNDLISAYMTVAAPLWLLPSYVLLACSFGFAILRYRLWDIDLLINRTLIYATLTAFVIGAYVLIVGGLGALIGTQGITLIPALLATGVIALLFQPVRERVQRGVNRLTYGERDDPYQVIAQLGQRLEATFEPSAVLPVVVQTIRDSLKLPYAAIVTIQNGTPQIATSTGETSLEPIPIPLTYQGESVGALLVAPRTGESVLSAADRRLLTDLAHQTGMAVHTVRLMDDLRRLNDALQQSLEQLVLAREEERKRLRRDLHDDLAPTLAGLGLRASTISELCLSNPTKAAAVADHLHDAIRDAVSSIRHLVYDLRPPALDELGLLGAIHERATLYSGSRNGANSLQVQVETPPTLPSLPAAVEVAAYRIVQEALMNVAKHACAQTCQIRVTVADALCIEIVDDGIGLSQTRSAGVGLRSMQERAAELGGTCEIESCVGQGTRIYVCLPITREASQ
jgi:signal transduction histidine kinase